MKQIKTEVKKQIIQLKNQNLPEQSKPNKTSLPVWRKSTVEITKGKYPTFVSFLEAANYDRISTIIEDQTRTTLIKSKSIKLCEIDFAYGRGAALSLISAYLIKFCDLLNFKDEAMLNSLQIKECARNIYTICNGITIPEIALMITHFTAGKYGTFFGNMNIMDISNWSRSYMNTRGEIISKNPDIKKFLLKRDQNFND